MTTEHDIRKYLDQRIRALGGETRAMKWIGRNHAPDVFVMLPPFTRVFSVDRLIWRDHGPILVECKAPGKRPRPGQVREHERMRKFGVTVLVLPTKEDIDKAFPL